jgi:hypothetical protein
MGHQSLYDLVLRDHFWVMRLSGKTYCLVAIVSRGNMAIDFLSGNVALTTFLCAIYDFAFTSACVSTGIVDFFYINE